MRWFFALFLIFLSSLAAAKPIEIITTENNGYELFVDGEPFLIKGVCYSPIPVGQDHNYNFWKDIKSIEEDAELMSRAGINVVRFYSVADNWEDTRTVIKLLYEKYGIYSIVGTWLGFWNYPYPFYADESFRQQVSDEVLEMVKNLKDQPGILMWGLGNENNFSFSGKVNPWTSKQLSEIDDPTEKINAKAAIYYSMVNDIARRIKEVDAQHPVAMGNGELITLDQAAMYAPDIDVLALIFYRGKRFGSMFDRVRNIFDKPVMLFEMGCDAYNAYIQQEDQSAQAEFLLEQWKDVYRHTVVSGNSEGNTLGGIIFEWTDEWWKHDPADAHGWRIHNTESTWSNGAYYFDIKAERNLNMNEEWFGLVGFRQNDSGAFLRKPRKSYYILSEFFHNPQVFMKDEK